MIFIKLYCMKIAGMHLKTIGSECFAKFSVHLTVFNNLKKNLGKSIANYLTKVKTVKLNLKMCL